MKLRLTINIGTVDAKALKLDAKKCGEGAVVDVDEKTGEKLLARGWATAATDEKSGEAATTESEPEKETSDASAIQQTEADPQLHAQRGRHGRSGDRR